MVDSENGDYIISDEEEAEEIRETDVLVLNIMDEKIPFSKQTLDLLRRYVLAFFGIPIQIQHPAKTAVSPPGQLALAEKTNRPLKQRVPRLPEQSDKKSTRISHLFECLKEQKLKGGGGEGPYPDCLGVLAITSGELFEDDTELEPWEPAPEERVYKFGVTRKDLKIGILSLAHLTPDYEKAHTCNLKRPAASRPATDNMEFPKAHRYRMYIRNLLKATSHYILKILGFDQCQNHRCLLYYKPFTSENHTFLCAQCDIQFCETMYKRFPPSGSSSPGKTGSASPGKTGSASPGKTETIRFFRDELLNLNGVDFSGYLLRKQKELALTGGKLPGRKKGDPPIVGPAPELRQQYFESSQPNVFFFAEKRYEEMAKALARINTRVMYLQYQMRIHQEFDRELEWLRYALKVFRAKLVERHHFLGRDEKNKVKRRSLKTLLQAVHQQTPTLEILHRTLEEPFLKFRSLADMKDAGPHQTPVPLENMGHAWAFFNKKHSTGGIFLECAGSLNQKTVGNFPKVGVNAQISNSNNPL